MKVIKRSILIYLFLLVSFNVKTHEVGDVEFSPQEIEDAVFEVAQAITPLVNIENTDNKVWVGARNQLKELMQNGELSESLEFVYEAMNSLVTLVPKMALEKALLDYNELLKKYALENAEDRNKPQLNFFGMQYLGQILESLYKKKNYINKDELQKWVKKDPKYFISLARIIKRKSFLALKENRK